jgi:hypothetical protein
MLTFPPFPQEYIVVLIFIVSIWPALQGDGPLTDFQHISLHTLGGRITRGQISCPWKQSALHFMILGQSASVRMLSRRKSLDNSLYN